VSCYTNLGWFLFLVKPSFHKRDSHWLVASGVFLDTKVFLFAVFLHGDKSYIPKKTHFDLNLKVDRFSCVSRV